MHISRLSISGFRSIKAEEIVPSKFNIFVGQNNHGKTNIFEAVEWFYNGSSYSSDIAHMQDATLNYSVEIEFSDIQAGIETIANESTREKFRKFAGGKDKIRVIRTRDEGKKRQLWDEDKNEWTSKNFAGFDAAFNDCIPRLEYISTSTHLNDVSKWGKKTPIGQMLSGVLTVLLEKSSTYRDFRAKFDEVFSSENSDIRVSLDQISGKVKIHLEEQFPDCTSVSFEILEPAFDDLLKSFEISIDDGIETRADEKGDGMQRALMLAIIKTYSDYRRETDKLGKRFVFLIDEAELHLHPTAQRQLKNALLSLAKNGDQIFINTHSSVLVTDDTDEQSVYRVVKKDCVTSFAKVTQAEKADVIYDLLGGSPSDLLLPQNFMIVEGRSDEIFLRLVLDRCYAGMPTLKIIFANGEIQEQEKTISSLDKVFTPLNQTPIYKERLIVLCDKPNEQQQKIYEKFELAYPHLKVSGQLLYMPFSSLEECYPLPWKTAEKMTMSEKTKLAGIAGKGISKDAFETHMSSMFCAVQMAWAKAHK